MICGLIGILYSLFDAMLSYADTAAIDDNFGIEILSWDKFIFKTIIYMVIGFVIGFIIQFGLRKIKRSLVCSF